MTTTYLELINRGARHNPERTAIVYGQKTLLFKEVDQLSSQLAHAFHAKNLLPKSRVALLVNNGLYSVPLDFACVRAGINRVPLNSRLSLQEHVKMLEETQATTVIVGEGLTERAAEIKHKLPHLHFYGLGTTFDNHPDLLAEAPSFPSTPPHIEAQADDVILTLFTSGTTGVLKAVQHTQASYAGICKNTLLNLLNIHQEDAMLHAASMIHASGVFVLPFWLHGAKTVIMSSFDPTEYLRLITAEKITTINLVPTMLQMLTEHPEFANTDVSHLKQVIYGTSPMPLPVIKKAMATWGREKFWQYYGQTECPLGIAILSPDHHDDDLLSACGKPAVDVEIRLVDEEGNVVPEGTPGEIVVRGPGLMAGYFNAPELNQEMFASDGWLHTRDIGVFDERGFLHLKDRTSDMIITGGYNVYPREIEDLLLQHPAVSECAVIGLKSTKWVEVVTAVVVLKQDATLTEQEVIDYVGQQIASYKKPQKVIFASEITKTAVGKLNRKALRELYADILVD